MDSVGRMTQQQRLNKLTMPSQEQIINAIRGLEKAERGNAIKLDHTIYSVADWAEHHIDTLKALLISNLEQPLEKTP